MSDLVGSQGLASFLLHTKVGSRMMELGLSGFMEVT